MKRMTRTAVVLMCVAWLLSLFGCGEPTVRDKEGMERAVPWTEFSYEQRSDVYEGNFSFTVKKEHDGIYVYAYSIATSGEEAEGVRLSEEEAAVLETMDLVGLPDETPSPLDAMILDGTFTKLYVTEEGGEPREKAAGAALLEQIETVLLPYSVV